MGDHTESIQVDFDPAVISYRQLLELFWGEHDPCNRSYSTQYKAALWVHDAEQRKVAEEMQRLIAAKTGRAVLTEILPVGTFTRAEDYHQKFYLRQWRRLAAEVLKRTGDGKAFTDSPAAAKLNGKPVVVTGVVRTRRGIEIARRTILTVESLAAAPVRADGPIWEIEGVRPKPAAFRPGGATKPLEIRSQEDAAKHFDAENLAALKKEVDFGKQMVLLFAWRGSGQDRLEYDVLESFPEQVRLRYQPGRTRDLRPHVKVFILRANVKWSVN